MDNQLDSAVGFPPFFSGVVRQGSGRGETRHLRLGRVDGLSFHKSPENCASSG